MNVKISMNIPQELLDRAVKASGAQTKTQAVILGLEELVKKRCIEEFIDMKGSQVIRLSNKEQRELRRR